MTTEIDGKKLEAFAMKALGDASGAMTTFMCAIGDRLGLFKVLAAQGPATSEDLAHRAGIHARYAREWASALAAAGYLAYEPSTRKFTLPSEHAQVLAVEGGPTFFGGFYQQFPGATRVYEPLVKAFRDGGGVPLDAYDKDWWQGMERFTNGWFENLLLPVWLPAAPDVHAKLEAGARVADLGCGAGRAVVKLAKAYPKSTFVGYDVVPAQVQRAKALAQAEGVADRVSFRVLDVAKGLPEQYDVITTFDLLHDLPDPVAALESVRRALAPDGRFLLLEMNPAESLEGNIGPVGAIMYAGSVVYCMSSAIAQGGEGLGTAGLPESKVRALCAKAGLGDVRRLPVDNPFNALYEVR